MSSPITSNNYPLTITADMSNPRTYQCLSCRLKTSTWRKADTVVRRQFHASTPVKARRRSAYQNIKASDLEQQHIRPYTEREKKLLSFKYTPEQMKIIEVGENAIDPKDVVTQGRMRTDPSRVQYLDDFASMRPVLDRPIEDSDLHDEQLSEGRNQRGRGRQVQQKQQALEQTEEVDPKMLRLSQQTGMTLDEIKRIRVKNLVSHRVVNQTRMGKIQSLYFLTIAGNNDGMVGIGEGKAAEDEDGRKQAMLRAIRNMKPIPRYEERTIYGEVEAKVSGTIVKLSARPPGK
jgi:small subunit ribosomal protein S5